MSREGVSTSKLTFHRVLITWLAAVTLFGTQECCGQLCQQPLKHDSPGSPDVIIGGLFPSHFFSSSSKGFVLNEPGIMWSEAMIFAVEEINNSSTLLTNVKLGYSIYDSCNEPFIAMQACLRMMAEPAYLAAYSARNGGSIGTCKCSGQTKAKLLAVVGDASSSQSVIVSSLMAAGNISQISYSSTSTDLSNKRTYPSFMRTLPPDNFQALVIADILRAYDWRYVAVVSSDDAYGRLGADNLLPELEKRGVCLAVKEVFDPKDNSAQINAIITKLLDEPRARVIVLWCQRQGAVAFLKAAKTRGLFDRIWIATESWGNAAQVYDLDERVVAGMFGIIPTLGLYPPFERRLAESTPSKTEYKPWLDEYWRHSDRHKCYPAAPLSGRYQRYSCPTSTKHDLTMLPKNKYANVMDAVYAIAHGLDDMLKATNDPVHPRWDSVTPSGLFQFVRRVNFTGKTGVPVNFDRLGDPGVASYSVTNLQRRDNQTMRFEIVGSWNSNSRRFVVDEGVTRLYFANWTATSPLSSCSEACPAGSYAFVSTAKKCCWKCVACPTGQVQPSPGQQTCNECGENKVANANRTRCLVPELDHLQFGGSLGVVVLFLSVVGVALVCFTVLVFSVHRDTPAVKASNRELSMLQLLSMAFIFLLPALFYTNATIALCAVRPFYFIVFYTISVSVTFTKTDRLLRIFKASKSGRLSRRSNVLSNRVQFLTVASLTAIGALLCAIMTASFRPVVGARTSYIGLRLTLSFYCADSYSLLFSLLLLYMFTIAIVCSVFAFRARKLPESYNEARYTTFAMFVFCVAWAMYLPLSLSLTRHRYKDAALCICSHIATFSMLLIVYGPKLHLILLHPSENTAEKFRAKMKTQSSHLPSSGDGHSPSKHRRYTVKAPGNNGAGSSQKAGGNAVCGPSSSSSGTSQQVSKPDLVAMRQINLSQLELNRHINSSCSSIPS